MNVVLAVVIFLLAAAVVLALAAVVGYVLEMRGRRRAGRVALWAIIVVGLPVASHLPQWIG